MTPEKKLNLEEAGFKVGTVQDFLGLTDAEVQEMEARLLVEMEMENFNLLVNLKLKNSGLELDCQVDQEGSIVIFIS